MMYVNHDDVRQIVAATFPEYSGKKFQVIAAESVTFQGLNWSGGSRAQYRACTLDGRALGAMDTHNQVAPWRNAAEGASVPIPEGACIVKHDIFNGKDYGITVYVHPANIAKYISNETVLSDMEVLVLHYTRTRKASYNGKNRHQLAEEDANCGYCKVNGYAWNKDNFPTKDEWKDTQDKLIAKGLLDKRHAITVAGKNIVTKDY